MIHLISNLVSFSKYLFFGQKHFLLFREILKGVGGGVKITVLKTSFIFCEMLRYNGWDGWKDGKKKGKLYLLSSKKNSFEEVLPLIKTTLCWPERQNLFCDFVFFYRSDKVFFWLVGPSVWPLRDIQNLDF